MNEFRHDFRFESTPEIMYPPIDQERLEKCDRDDRILIEKHYNELMVNRAQRLYTAYKKIYLEPHQQYDLDAQQVQEFDKLLQAAGEECFEIARDKVRIIKGENDDLTGLLRRDAFAARYEIALRAFERTQPEDEVISFLFVDIDDMNRLNTTYGHAPVDMLLKALGQKLLKEIRAVDAVCRHGGDEVLVLLNHIKRDAVESTVERIYAALATLSIIKEANGNYRVRDLANESLAEGETLEDQLSMSMGVRTLEAKEIGHLPMIEQITLETDNAVYHTKSLGKDGITFLEGEHPDTKEPTVTSHKFNRNNGSFNLIGERGQKLSKEAVQSPEVISNEIKAKLRRTLECAYQKHNKQLPANIEQAIGNLAEQIYGVCYT